MSGLVVVPAVAARFFSKVRVEESGCVVWTAARRGKGYGSFRDGKTVYAHRWSYEFSRGPIPAGLTIDHLCRNKLCVNPEHLEPVTASENQRRSVPFLPHPAATHCGRGHPLSAENLLIKPASPRHPWAQRCCRVCDRRRCREYKARRALKAVVR